LIHCEAAEALLDLAGPGLNELWVQPVPENALTRLLQRLDTRHAGLRLLACYVSGETEFSWSLIESIVAHGNKLEELMLDGLTETTASYQMRLPILFWRRLAKRLHVLRKLAIRPTLDPDYNGPESFTVSHSAEFPDIC
jgi:hypothetical protein